MKLLKGCPNRTHFLKPNRLLYRKWRFFSKSSLLLHVIYIFWSPCVFLDKGLGRAHHVGPDTLLTVVKACALLVSPQPPENKETTSRRRGNKPRFLAWLMSNLKTDARGKTFTCFSSLLFFFFFALTEFAASCKCRQVHRHPKSVIL